jgi:hypothetical protein
LSWILQNFQPLVENTKKTEAHTSIYAIWDFSRCRPLHNNKDLVYPRGLGYLTSLSGNSLEHESWQFSHQGESLQTGLRGLYPGEGIYNVISRISKDTTQLSTKWLPNVCPRVKLGRSLKLITTLTAPIILMFKMLPIHLRDFVF